MIPLLLSTLRIALPYALAATAGLVCELAGVSNLALEGLMLWAAFIGCVAVLLTHSMWVAAVVAVVATVLMAVSFVYVAERQTGEPILLGIAFNMLAAAGTRLLLKLLYDSSSNSPAITEDLPTTSLAIIFVVGTALWLRRSVHSRRLLAAGATPLALRDQGLSALRYRYLAYAIAGALLAWGGLDLLFGQQRFTDGMVAGRGYIAVAAVVFGQKRFGWTVGICVLFAAAEALQLQVQSSAALPTQLVQSLPYLLCLLAMTLRAKRVVH